MPKKSSTLARSKKAENRMSKYLWGDDHYRDWKEEHDISGLDADGEMWWGEVKNAQWPSGPGGLQTLLDAAWEQVIGYGDGEHVFVAYLPPHASAGDALILHRRQNCRVIVTAREFREDVLGYE